MMAIWAYAGFGVDSLAVGTALGATRMAKGSELRLIGLLGLFDAAATCAAGRGWPAAILLTAAAATAALTLCGLRRSVGRAFLVLALTGIDNLLAPHPWREALPAGLASALMAALGLLLAGPLLARIADRLRAWGRARPPLARA
jgi:hypothetical protein